jgi:Pyruvate/2-oxoacid:ferredoxin oxidoreductase delta subunit
VIERPPCPLPPRDEPGAGKGEPVILTLEEARAEAQRCLSLSSCRGCELCVLVCPDLAITLDDVTGRPVVDLSYCKGCELCAQYCPKGAIRMALEAAIDESKGTPLKKP